MNKYKNELDSIKASESFKTETIKLMNENQSSPVKSRNTKWAATGAIAACLALLIGATALFSDFGSAQNNRFVLTAYAAEASKGEKLNNKSFVEVGKIKDFSATTSFIAGKTNDDNEIIETYPENGSTIAEAQHEFVFNLNCKGKGIDTVTFNAGNGKFKLSTANSKIVATTGKSKKYNSMVENDNYYCDSFTTEYNDQIWNVEPVFAEDESGNQAYDTVYPRLCLETKVEKYEKGKAPKAVRDFFDWYGDGMNPKEISTTEKKALYEAYIDYFVRDLEVSVTAKFKDGSEQTQKVQFKSEFLENDENGAQFTLKAKIV